MTVNMSSSVSVYILFATDIIVVSQRLIRPDQFHYIPPDHDSFYMFVNDL